MVDRYVATARIAKIHEYVVLLRRIRSMADERRFASGPLVHGYAERYLQLAIQAVLDISHHLCSAATVPDSRSIRVTRMTDWSPPPSVHAAMSVSPL